MVSKKLGSLGTNGEDYNTYKKHIKTLKDEEIGGIWRKNETKHGEKSKDSLKESKKRH